MPSRRRVHSLAVVLTLGALVLAGCDDAQDAAAPDTDAVTGAGVDVDGDGDVDADDEAAQSEPGPVEPPTEPAAITAAPGERSATQDGGTITVEGDRAAFVLPSGNIACVLTDQTATCQIFDKGYTPDAAYLVTDLVGPCAIEDANAMRLVEESAAWTCVTEDLTSDARVEQGGWWEREIDGDTLEVDGARVGVLPYGETLRVGPVSCTSSEGGVECRNPELNGRRFVLSKDSYLFDRNA